MKNADVGKLVLRLTLGVLLLLHGIAKLKGVGGIEGMLQGVGLPPVLAYGVFLGEIVGPLMVLFGWQMLVGLVLIIINMLFAIGLAHSHEVFAVTPHGGWAIELQAMYLLLAVALLFLGPGRFALQKN